MVRLFLVILTTILVGASCVIAANGKTLSPSARGPSVPPIQPGREPVVHSPVVAKYPLLGTGEIDLDALSFEEAGTRADLKFAVTATSLTLTPTNGATMALVSGAVYENCLAARYSASEVRIEGRDMAFACFHDNGGHLSLIEAGRASGRPPASSGAAGPSAGSGTPWWGAKLTTW